MNTTIISNGTTFSACSPDLAVDSVEVTNTRAVVITTKRVGIQAIMVAYVYDLTTSPVLRLASIPIVGPSFPALEVVAHDLAITPDGTRAVVTGNFEVGLIDLSTTPPSAKIYENGVENRSYKFNVDSVEVTNSRCVTTSTNFTTGPAQWQVDVFDLNALFVPMSGFPWNPGHPGHAHDLAISPNGKQAVVRAGNEIAVLQSLDTAPAQFLISSLNSDPLNAYPANFAHSFVSDSIIATNSLAVSIGTGTTVADGFVAFADISTTPPTLIVESAIPHTGPFNRVRAGDLEFTPDGKRVVIRSSDVDPLGSATTNDLRFYACAPAPTIGALLASFSATDNIFGVDSLAVGTTSLISVSENRVANNGSGKVQIVTIP